MSQIGLTEVQAEAVLEIKLRSLVHMEKEKVEQELESLLKAIAEYTEILNSETKLLEVIAEELKHVKKLFADQRRTLIGFSDQQTETVQAAEETFFIELLEYGIIRRSKTQTNLVDFIEVQGSDPVMFLTNFGKIFCISAYEIPESQRGVA